MLGQISRLDADSVLQCIDGALSIAETFDDVDARWMPKHLKDARFETAERVQMIGRHGDEISFWHNEYSNFRIYYIS